MVREARHSTLVLSVASLALALQATSAAGGPLELHDATPREIVVRFETSPREEPALRDREYGPPLPARIEPAGADLVRVVIDGDMVEKHLFGRDIAEPGSFGDFVWLFDTRTGHVLDARVEGRIEQQIDWGLMRSTTQARVQVRMSTREQAGFLPRRRILGNTVFRHCDPAASGSRKCRAVEPVPYDAARGYVNAVGAIQVDTPLGVEAKTFSPLGEALFLELDTAAEPTTVVDAPQLQPVTFVE